MNQPMTKQEAIDTHELNGEAIISSLRITEITNKRHADVLRDIEKTLEDHKIGASRFASSYITSQNKKSKHYLLPEREFNLVASRYSAKYKLQLTDDWEAHKSYKAQNIVPASSEKGSDSQQKMSTRRIAEVTGKAHDNVLRDARKALNNCGISLLKFEETYLDKSGRRQICYMLPEREFMLVISGYSDKYRLQLIDELLGYRKNTEVLPDFSDPVAAARAWADAKENEAKALLETKKKDEVIKKKDEIILAVADLNIKAGEITVGDLAKNLAIKGLGQNNLFKWLKGRGFLMLNTAPYQQYVERGYFVRKPSQEKINGRYRYTTYVTPKGSTWITKMVRAEFDLD